MSEERIDQVGTEASGNNDKPKTSADYFRESFAFTPKNIAITVIIGIICVVFAVFYVRADEDCSDETEGSYQCHVWHGGDLDDTYEIRQCQSGKWVSVQECSRFGKCTNGVISCDW